jgi:hypothetical protein
LGVSKIGLPALVLFDENGKDRAELHVTSGGKPGFALADETGKSVVGLPERAALHNSRTHIKTYVRAAWY